MAKEWQRETDDRRYTVRLRPKGELIFEVEGIGDEVAHLADHRDAIWVEEFPEKERRHEWIREHLDGETLGEVESAVEVQLEERMGTRRADLERLVERLEHENPEKVVEAADRIRSYGERWNELIPDGVEAIAAYLDDDEAVVRRGCTEALRRLAAEEPGAVLAVVDELRPCLRDDDPGVRLEAAKALSTIARERGGDRGLLDDVVETLIGLLVNRTSLFSRGPVAGLLGDIGRIDAEAVEPAVEPLVQFVTDPSEVGSSTSGLGRSTAVQALVEIGRQRFELIEPYIDVFFEQTDAKRPEIRRHAARAIALIGREDSDFANQAITALEGMEEDRPSVRTEVEGALNKLKPRRGDAENE